MFAQLLRELRASSGGPGSRMYIAAMGQQLSRAGFNPQRDLGMKLAHVLRQMPAFCTVEGNVLIFLDGEPEFRNIRPSRQILRRDLWDAMVSEIPEARHYLDLDHQQILRVPVIGDLPGPPVAEEPYRYLEVPQLSTESQLAFAAHWLDTRVPAEPRRQILASGRDWMRTSRQMLSAGLFEELRHSRREWVHGHALQWLAKHHLRIDRFMTTLVEPRRAISHGARGEEVDRLRARLHEVIDQMTGDELKALSVPARFLVE